ncbi:hypothetical protein ACFS07_26050 [Undibacterium arcticum]
MTSTKLTALAFAAVLVAGCATNPPTAAPGFQYQVPGSAYKASNVPAGYTEKGWLDREKNSWLRPPTRWQSMPVIRS